MAPYYATQFMKWIKERRKPKQILLNLASYQIVSQDLIGNMDYHKEISSFEELNKKSYLYKAGELGYLTQITGNTVKNFELLKKENLQSFALDTRINIESYFQNLVLVLSSGNILDSNYIQKNTFFLGESNLDGTFSETNIPLYLNLEDQNNHVLYPSSLAERRLKKAVKNLKLNPTIWPLMLLLALGQGMLFPLLL